MFDVFDENKDGKISRGEVKQMMEKLGQTCSDGEVDDIMKSADTDGIFAKCSKSNSSMINTT